MSVFSRVPIQDDEITVRVMEMLCCRIIQRHFPNAGFSHKLAPSVLPFRC
jgi:hypothetical protein